jgi:hypothetical protein
VIGAALVAVRTTGINWESVGVIVGSVVALIAFLVSVQDRRNATVQHSIQESVDHLSDVLIAKLETKETVAKLSERIARLETAVLDSGHPEQSGPH